MTCAELRALLELEGTADSEEARTHLLACQACATEVQRWLAVRAALRDIGREPAPPFLHSRIMAHVRAEAPAAHARAWLRGWRAPALAGAGAAVLILGLGLFRAVKPPAATPVAALGGSAEKLTKLVPGVPLDKGDARPPAPAAPTPVPAPAVRDEKVANEQQVERRKVSDAKDDLAFAPRAEAGKNQAHPSETEARQPSGGGAAPSVVAQAATAQEGVSRLEVTAGAVAASGREAPMAGTLRAVEQKKEEQAAVVRCRLQLEGDGEVLDLELPVAQAPPPHEVWSVTVASDGRIEVLDARGRTQQAPAVLHQGLSQQQRQQQLRLGRYRLSQAPVPATPAP